MSHSIYQQSHLKCSFQSNHNDPYEESANRLPSLLPFGFTCIGRIYHHTGRVTALHVAMIDSFSEDDQTIKKDRSNKAASILNSIGIRSSGKVPNTTRSKHASNLMGQNQSFLDRSPTDGSDITSSSPIDTNLMKQSKYNLRLFIGDSNGIVSSYELTSGRTLAILQPLGIQVGFTDHTILQLMIFINIL